MTKSNEPRSDDRDGMRNDMREFHRIFMFTLWLFLGMASAIGFVIWATLYFSGQLVE